MLGQLGWECARLKQRHLDAGRLQLIAIGLRQCCLLYTSDAADERSSVDLGGRRIIKKKKHISDRVRRHVLIHTYEQYTPSTDADITDQGGSRD